MKFLSMMVLICASTSFASDRIAIQKSETVATCFTSKAQALGSALLKMTSEARQECVSKSGIPQETQSDLKINLDLKNETLCGGVKADYTMDCIIP